MKKSIGALLIMSLLFAGPLSGASASSEPSEGPPEIPAADLQIPLPDLGSELLVPEDPKTAPDVLKRPPSSEPAKEKAPSAAGETGAITGTQEAAESPATPTPPLPTPTPMKASPKRVKPAPPVPTATVAPASIQQVTAPSADYFPAVQGEKKEYQFFRLPGQEVGRMNRVVECLDAKVFPNGTVRSTFKTTVFAGGTYKDGISTDSYSAYGNAVEQTTHNDQPLAGRFLLKVPKPGGVERWVHDEGNGRARYFKAYFSPLKTDERIYSECLVVVEKSVQGKSDLSLRYLYYAKGAGLVRLEVYGPDLKMDRSSSLDVVTTAPAGGVSSAPPSE